MQDVFIATSTITNGNMSERFDDADVVAKNRERFLATQNLETQNTVWMQCDHGTTITPVNWSNGGETVATEVLVTQEKGLALALLTADCLPVTFYDPITSTLALAHMSRVTIAANLPKHIGQSLALANGVDLGNVRVHIGPHIAADSYVFPNTGDDFPDAIEAYTNRTNTLVQIDLVAAHNHQLTSIGVLPENISVDQINTATSPQHFSHYAATTLQKPDKAGRITTVAMMR